MKTESLILPVRLTSLLVATVVFTSIAPTRAAKPLPSPSPKASLEVLVTGDLASVPDHTAAADGSYDVCRDTSFSGSNVDQLVLRKLRLDLTLVSPYVSCVNPGIPPAGLAVLRFPAKAASVGAEVFATYNFPGKYQNTAGEAYEVVYHLDMVGSITGGQWPPTELNPTLEITLSGWTRLYAGAKDKNACKVTPIPPILFAEEVVFTITRNDAAHTNEDCDCPFDYEPDLVCP